MDFGKEETENGKTDEWGPSESESEARISSADTETPASPLLSPIPGKDEGRFKATPSPSPSHPDDVENGRVADSEFQIKDSEGGNSHDRSPKSFSSLAPVAQTSDNISAPANVSQDTADGNAKPELTISRFIKSRANSVKNVIFTARPFSTRTFLNESIFPFRSSGRSHPMKIAVLSLRLGAVILSTIAFSVMCATAEDRQGAGSTFTMKFNDFGAYNYLVAINVITFAYSLSLLVMSIRLIDKTDLSLFSYKESLQVYAADQVLAFLLFSASTAAATAAQLSRHGLQHIWPPACSTWNLSVFCSKADAAVTISFFASFCVIGSAVISGHHLSKLLPNT